MSDTQIPLQPDVYYHIYNHAVGKENLFDNEKDYARFLSGIRKYISPIADIFAYSLMPNHFHLVIRMKGENEIKRHLQFFSKRPIDFVEMEKKNSHFLNDKISLFKPDEWKYSSHNAIISSNQTLIPREEVIELFGDLKNFIYCNSKPADIDID